MIALIAATEIETGLVREALTGTAEAKCGRYDLLKGRIDGQLVSLLHTGIGKVNGALATEALLDKRRPKAVILFGCGGAYPDRGLKIGDIALAEEEIYGDEGVRTPDGFLDMQKIGFPLCSNADASYYNHLPLHQGLQAEARARLKAFISPRGKHLVTGPFVTVSTCSGTDERGRELADRTGGICESMEGAAVNHVCLQHDVPLLEIRGISNLTEDRNPDQWDIGTAAEISQQCILELIRDWPAMEKTL
ncbi:MAG: futalosine hydrolase [Desulfuromonas sp.]|nr:MAG: futalosine hydrolase [Desulfuromonas sp.]